MLHDHVPTTSMISFVRSISFLFTRRYRRSVLMAAAYYELDGFTFFGDDPGFVITTGRTGARSMMSIIMA
jgi:hypothetical protein